MTPVIPDRSGTTVGDRYVLLSRIGSGGFGAVYEARDQKLDRRVAVKLFHSWWALDPEWTARFEAEARLTASLGDPGIVMVHDTGIDEEAGLWIVLEFVDGESLASRMARGPLKQADAVAICARVLDALQVAHTRGIVHRDVGPQNVLLGADGAVKITDFGVAYLSTGATRTSSQATIVGKPLYMSPEQSRGKPVGPASDVYAVGVLLYELLAGHPPFDGDSFVEIALKHNSEKVPPLPDRIPPRLAAVVTRALEKDPTHRFGSAADMASALRMDQPNEFATTRVMRTNARAVFAASEEETLPLPRRGSRWRRKAVVTVAVLAVVAAATAIVLTRDRAPTRAGSQLSAGRHAVSQTSRTSTPDPKAGLVRIPNLVGLPGTAARRRATAGHLELREATVPSASVAIGRVAHQQPLPGRRVARGSVIIATISTGPPLTTVPVLTGMPTARAEHILATAHLKSRIELVPNHGDTPGTVLDQTPPRDTVASPGANVTLYVAREPSWQTVLTQTLNSAGSSPIFKITGTKWRIRYTLTFGSCTAGFCDGPTMTVSGAGGSFAYQSYTLSAGSHETYVPEPAGRYSVDVANGIDPYTVQIVIEQYD